jgi:hypothetical protein
VKSTKFKFRHCIWIRERMNTVGMGSNRRPAPHLTYIAHHHSVNTSNKLRTRGETERTISIMQGGNWCGWEKERRGETAARQTDMESYDRSFPDLTFDRDQLFYYIHVAAALLPGSNILWILV